MALRLIPNQLVTLGDGTEAFMELNADTADDLATEFEGYTIAAGSICYVIATAELYILDGSGTWINQSSDEGGGT